MSIKKYAAIKAARAALFKILIWGVAMAIITPVFFLFSISLMSDAEVYNEWPLPLFPSFRAHFKITKAENGCSVELFNRGEGKYIPLITSPDAGRISQFIRRKTNCRVDEDTLGNKIAELAPDGEVLFSLNKNIFENYISFFRVTDHALPSLMRSLQTAIMTILISLLVGAPAGYAFARHVFAGRNLLKTGVLFVRIFPAIAIAMPMVILLSRIGLYDNPAGLAISYAVGQTALTVWLSAGIFIGISKDLEEAAQVFGATRTSAFFSVTLPLALPGLAACAMYAFIGSWNETIQAIILTQSNPTFPVVVYQTLVGAKSMINLAAAGGTAMALPALIFTWIIRNYILRMWSGSTI
jgi:multiple sugar transport system permease protein